MKYVKGSQIYLWDLDGSRSQNEWPVFQHDSQHTGFYETDDPSQRGNYPLHFSSGIRLANTETMNPSLAIDENEEIMHLAYENNKDIIYNRIQ